MHEVATLEVAGWLDEYLRITQVPDYPPALNGLQVENAGRVTRIAAAVDASEQAIAAAAKRGCDLLLVHHGLFWDGNQPVTGRRYRKLSGLLRDGIAVYSAHLPLDVHPECGNNVVLARALGMEPEGEFGEYRGMPAGCWGRLDVKREVLAARLDEVLGGRVRMVAGGPEVVRRVGVVTGSGGGMIGAALEAGLDALVTGEGAHHTYFDAVEGGLNVYFGGHYATETFGVRALAERLAERFSIPWEFLELPTGT
ncbi:MAG TPA: Nif3-like dinuclear metal center hexameric protein [Longimicrobiales bacterium]|nr:Nif3-like dinuclear metal center hexameric protein [Longimicrobiales bacterium]